MIKKFFYVLIYRNKFFIPLICAICLAIVFLVFSLFSKIEAKNRKNENIYPAGFSFDVPLEVMEQALDVVEKNYEKKAQNELNFINLISLLAAKYDGEWNDYSDADLKVFADEFGRGLTESEIATPYEKNYGAFKNFYEAVFKETVGPFKISKTVDENNRPVFENKFGLKSYFPIAYEFYASFLDDYEKENKHLSSVHHLGVDLNAKLKTPVVAVESGVVEDCGQTRDFGWQLKVKSFDGLRTYYYSNCYGKQPFAEGIKEKAVVKAGQVVAYVGANTCCRQKVVRAKNWPHLHFGMSLKLNKNEVFINPYRYLQFLQHHKSVVEKEQKGFGFQNKYCFEDPSVEAYLKKQEN